MTTEVFRFTKPNGDVDVFTGTQGDAMVHWARNDHRYAYLVDADGFLMAGDNSEAAECLDCHAAVSLAWIDRTDGPRCPARNGGHRVTRAAFDAWAGELPTDDDETLGSCGCVDYHVADCPTRTGYADALSRAEYAHDDFYGDAR